MMTTIVLGQTPDNIQRYRHDAQGNYSNRRQGIMDGNAIRTIFSNNGEVAQWPYAPSMEWPKGTGHQYLDGYCLFLAARVTAPGNKQVVHPLETSYREEMPLDPATGTIMGLEPIGGYVSSTVAGNTPAMNTDVTSYPIAWPTALGLGPEWNGQWVGFFGKGSASGCEETFFVMDDSKDGKFKKAPYSFYPIAADSLRGGLGLRVEVHGLQVPDQGLQDVMFWDYRVTNISDYNYDSTVVGFFIDPGVGGVGSGNDDASMNMANDLCYQWDNDGKGDPAYGVWTPGYFGFSIMEFSPGKSGNKIASMSLSSLADKSSTGAWPKNNEVIWAKMTGGFADTALENANITVVLGSQSFAFPKWTTEHVTVAMIIGKDVSELVAKKTASQSFLDQPRAGGDTTLYHQAAIVSRKSVGTGTLKVRMLDAGSVTGHKYLLTFNAKNGGGLTGTVIDLATGVTKISGLEPLDGAHESVTFDGIRVSIADEVVALDTINSGWRQGSSSFPVTVTFDNSIPSLNKHMPYDYELTFSNINVDTSNGDLDPSTYPAIPVPFTVKNLTLNTKPISLIRDNDMSHSFSKGDNILFMDINGRMMNMMWNVGFGSAEAKEALPTIGDVYRIITRKPFIVGDSITFSTQGLTNVEQYQSTLPFDYALEQNYPNPFNPTTTIQFSIPVDNTVDLKVYDALGKEVAVLVHEFLHAGKYRISFDGSALSSGMYFYRIEAGNYSMSRKLLLLK